MKGVSQEQNLSAGTMLTASAHAFIRGHFYKFKLKLHIEDSVQQIRFVIYHYATNSIVSKLEVG